MAATPSSNVVSPDALQTVFAPGDGPRRMELGQLDAIIAAKRADPKTYPPESNPYRIEYAVYNLTDPDVISRLTEAARAGIRVQLLVETKNSDPSKPWNTAVGELTAAGFSHAESQHGLSEQAQRDTQIIEIDIGSGLFHLKSRYFAYPDPQTGQLKETLLTGSHNPQSSAHTNDESLHQISDPGLIKKYLTAIENVRGDRPIQNTWEDGAAVNALFTSPTATGPRPVQKILELVKNERELIFLSVFALRDITDADSKARLVEELKKAHERGVKVVVVTDAKMADGVDLSGKPNPEARPDDTDERLAQAGIPVFKFFNRSGPFNAMHLKSAVFGVTNPKVVTDAGNWSAATMGTDRSPSKNVESLLFIDSNKLDQGRTGQRYLGEFMRVMRRYADQPGHGPDVEATLRELQALPAWPKVKVNFDVLARTHMGQDVYIAGNTPELGSWGTGGPGLKLDTDAGSFPYWKRADVELPLGARLEYKVVKRDANGNVDWEPGQDAVLIVDPTESADPKRLGVSEDFNGDR